MMRKNLTARWGASLATSKLRKLGLLTLMIVGVAWLGTQVGSAFPFSRMASIFDTDGVLSGTVYQDYNANGRRDTAATITNAGGGTLPVAVDRGVAGVTVTAYAGDGSTAGTATTDANGAYSLNASGNGPYRLEFTNLPAGYFPSPVGENSGTNVRFISGATASNLDFGIVLPEAYCQDNPTLITARYVGGNQSGSDPVIVSFPNSSGSARTSGDGPFTDFDQPAQGNLVNSNVVGTVWGLAYARGTRSLYAASFMKKHAGFGPSGPGAIYRINPANGATSLLVDAGALAGANPHNPSDFDRDNGNATWNAVGKLSFGGIALNGAETRLYAMNLNDRRLYEFPTDAQVTAANTRASAPITAAPNCANGDVRPFAVHWSAGALYVGVTCTAESTQSAAGMQAYVYRVDPATLALDATPLFQTALNYPRRCADSAQNGPGSCFSAAWRPWTSAFANIGTDGRAIYPQPWLTDIAFDRGSLILGIRDRAGDQLGTDTLDNPADNTRYYGVSAGDTLRAASNGAGGFTLESNGRAGGNGTAPQGTNEGPGGGEFYFQDNAPPFGDEISLGALVQIPGQPNVIVNSYDPIPIPAINTLFDGGPVWHNNNTGARSKSYRVYDGSRTGNPGVDFGKANGLGDIVALCDLAPIELGNRVWNDIDCDGIQDAGESGISGLTVQLIKDGNVVATTLTNADGNYYFNNGNVTGGVLPNMAYQICLLQLPTGFALSPKDADSSTNGDIRDSDAALVDGKACIPVTTGGPGSSNHDLDFGVNAIALTCPPNQTATAPAGQTSTVVNYPAPTAKPADAQVTCTPASGSSFPVGSTTVTCTATSGGSSASCSFVVNVVALPSISCPAPVNACAVAGQTSATVSYAAPTTTGSGVTVVCAPASGSSFAIGTTTVTCTASNSAGQASCSFAVTVTAPPTITCPTNVTATATSVDGAAVTYPAPTASAGATVSCDRASGSTFPIGTTTVTCTATNICGTQSCSFTVTVSATAPTISCPAPVSACATAGATTATVNYPAPTATGIGTSVSCNPASGSSFAVGTTTVTCTATNAGGQASCSFVVTVTATPTITCPTNVTATATSADGAAVTYPAPTATGAGATVTCDRASGSTFPIGTTTVTCTATNSCGTQSCSFTVTVNATAPTISCPAPVNACATAGASSTTVTYVAPTATGIGTSVVCAPASGASFAVGTTTVTCRATNAGGEASCSFVVTVAQAPAITCPTNVTTQATSPAGATVTYNAPTATGTNAVVSCDRASGSTFPIGTTTVTCTASNSCGTQSCSFTVTVTAVDPPTIMCPENIKVPATSPAGAVVNYPAPKITGVGATVTCDRASGSTFPIGTTTVKCTVTNAFGMAMCTFTVTVDPQTKCDTLCYRAPQWWLLNLDRLPGGTVIIYGVNNSLPVDTSKWRTIQSALQGNPFGFGLTAIQKFNQEYVAAQLNILSYGGPGAPTVANTMWANLSCYQIRFDPITLSSGAVLTPDSMVKELYMHITAAVQGRRTDDLVKLTQVLDLLNGNDALGSCN